MPRQYLAIENFDFTSDDGLKAACDNARSRVDRPAARQLADFLREIRDTPPEGRASLEFQKRVWTDDRIFGGGIATEANIELLLGDDEFRARFADQTAEPLPSDPGERTERLTAIFDGLLERAGQVLEWKPWVESLRAMAHFFPEDFTSVANTDELAKFANRIGRPASQEFPVEANRRILTRFAEVLGPPADGVGGAVERMMLLDRFYALYVRRQQLWFVRAKSEGEDEQYVLDNGLAMLGFENVPDPTPHEWEDYERLVTEKTDAGTKAAGQVWDFAHNILENDIVVLPQKKGDRLVAWGRVTGDYEHREIEGEQRHTLPVEWVRSDLPRASFDPADRTAFNWNGTVKQVSNPGADRIMSVLREGGAPPSTEPSAGFGKLWNTLSADANDARLRFDRPIVEALHLGLWADEQRHFAVLSGLSGTGKTQIALRYAMALTGAESDTGGPVEVISVHPGWHDPGPLLGYVNPLSGGYTRTEFLNFLLDAVEKPDQPHVLILDEMNLSHPEQYFAPILSAMEIRGGEIPLHREDEEKLGVPTGVAYPKNLVIIGTVNMDETTMGISDKVLDRAFTLEFWDIEPEEWPGWESCGLDDPEKRKVRGLLTELTKALAPARRHFGWRVIAEVVGFLEGRSGDAGIEIGADAALDQVIYAKVLPKLRGSDTPRFRQCLEDTIAVLKKAGLEKCAEKVRGLQEDLEATGSCSFWR